MEKRSVEGKLSGNAAFHRIFANTFSSFSQITITYPPWLFSFFFDELFILLFFEDECADVWRMFEDMRLLFRVFRLDYISNTCYLDCTNWFFTTSLRYFLREMKKITDVWMYIYENTRDAEIFNTRNEIYTCRNIFRFGMKLLYRF